MGVMGVIHVRVRTDIPQCSTQMSNHSVLLEADALATGLRLYPGTCDSLSFASPLLANREWPRPTADVPRVLSFVAGTRSFYISPTKWN